ncbi:60S ribosomal protein L2, mitochondrial [Arachis stenosperma]|uniref:60S ribosomal protein L2, mitochondrial n=1 Tax=Arachis stenosperma TaxID=217475 RepID=UPI0025AD09E7|nr:60S ribosomal protein L2, mitochondrial [Arachis stenosperma]
MSSVKRALRQFTFGTGKTAGRNSSGRITSFHRGGGAKRLQRIIDLKRNAAPSSGGVVERIEYDPNRSSSIALVRWTEGVRRRAMPEKALAQPSRKSLQIDNSIEGNNNIRGVLAFNLMLPPQHAGSASRNAFLSAFSPKGKAASASASASGSESLPLGLPRIAVVASRASFFAPRARGEEKLQVRNWKKNNDVWTHRNKRKAAISWHGIAR